MNTSTSTPITQTTLEPSNLAVIHLENAACEAVIALQGAQILKYRAKSLRADAATDLLWCSQHLPQQGEKAIRGGIPLCFPWFGAHPQSSQSQAHLPAHGFARMLMWELEQVHSSANEHVLQFVLRSSPHSKVYWKHDFEARMTIRCGQALTLEFNVVNTDTTAFRFGFAWHSYFAVQTLSAVRIGGLTHSHYIDQLAVVNPHVEQAKWIQITAETDRIYTQTQRRFSIQEPNRCIEIISPDCPDAVLWNPWIEKAARLPDMDNHAWQEFVCLESGHIQHWLELQPQQSQTFCMTLRQQTKPEL